MNRRTFFCGLAVSPLAVLALPARQVADAKTLTSIRIKVDSTEIHAFVEKVDREVARSLARFDEAAARQVQDIADRRG